MSRPTPSIVHHSSYRPAPQPTSNSCGGESKSMCISRQPPAVIPYFPGSTAMSRQFPLSRSMNRGPSIFWQCLQIKSLTRVELMACMDISVVDSDICPPAIDDCCGDSKKDKRWTMDVCSACQDMSGGCADSKATKNECTSSTNEWRGEKFAYWILLKNFHERYFFDWYLLHNSKTLVISIGFRKPMVYVLWCICLFLQRRSRSNDQLPKHY